YIRHIKEFPIGRADDAIRLDQVGGYDHRLIFSLWQVIYLHPIQVRLRPGPVRTLIIGICKIDTTLAIDPKVIGTVEQASSKVFHQDSDFFTGSNGPQLILLIGAGHQVALFVEIHAIASAGAIQEQREMAIEIILPYPVIRLIRKKNIPLMVDSSPFRKAELAGDQPGCIARADDGITVEDGGLSLYQGKGGQTGQGK